MNKHDVNKWEKHFKTNNTQMIWKQFILFKLYLVKKSLWHTNLLILSI